MFNFSLQTCKKDRQRMSHFPFFVAQKPEAQSTWTPLALWALKALYPFNNQWSSNYYPSASCHTLRSQLSMTWSSYFFLLPHIGFIWAYFFYTFFQIISSLRAKPLENITVPHHSLDAAHMNTPKRPACGLDLPNLGCNIRAQGSSCRSAQRSVSDQPGSHL